MTSTGYYLTQIAEGLAAEEVFDVGVICGQPSYSARGTRAARRETVNGVEIFRATGTTLDKNVIAFRLLNMVTLSLSVFAAVLRRFKKGDLVLVVTNPPTMPFVCAVAALVRGASYVLLIHDNYPEILIAAGKTREGSAFARLAAHLNRWLFKYASRIIVCGRDMKELVERKAAGLDVPVTAIRNWAELETVAPVAREDSGLLRESGFGDRLVFLYAGNMGYPNDVETIAAVAARYREDERFGFVFLGDGVKRARLEREIGRLPNVRLFAPRPRSQQTDFLAGCDVALVSLVGRMRGVSVPSRTYNILAAGRPILAIVEPGSEVEMVVRERCVGWSVPPGDADALAAVIEDVWNARTDFRELGNRARAAAVEEYSAASAIMEYKAALASDNDARNDRVVISE